MSLNSRAKQNTIVFRLGIIMMAVGSMGFIGIVSLILLRIFFRNMNALLMVCMALISVSVFFTLFFSRMGWHEVRIIDFILNQLSILLTVFGFFLLTKTFLDNMQGERIALGLSFVFIGIILAGLGIKYTAVEGNVN